MAAIYAILDVPRQMQAIKKNTMHMDFAPAFFLFLICFVLLFPITYLFWTYDLSSTWSWTELIGLRESDTTTFRQGVVKGIETASPGMIASILLWAFTWTPSLIEMGFPRIAKGSPAIGIFLKACIAFDYITDLPLVWNLVHGQVDEAGVEIKAGWFQSWGYAQLPAQLVATGFVTLITSLVLQVIIVLLLYICIRLFITMGMGTMKGDQRGPTVIMVDEERIVRPDRLLGE